MHTFDRVHNIMLSVVLRAIQNRIMLIKYVYRKCFFFVYRKHLGPNKCIQNLAVVRHVPVNNAVKKSDLKTQMYRLKDDVYA